MKKRHLQIISIVLVLVLCITGVPDMAARGEFDVPETESGAGADALELEEEAVEESNDGADGELEDDLDVDDEAEGADEWNDEGNEEPSAEDEDWGDESDIDEEDEQEEFDEIDVYDDVDMEDEDSDADDADEVSEDGDLDADARYADMPAEELHRESADGVQVWASYGKGVFPDGTEMVLTDVPKEEVMAQVSGVIGNVVDAAGVDISFYDADGEELQPQDGAVRVSLSLGAPLEEGDGQAVVHIADDGEVTELSEDEVVDASASGAEFVAEEFSTYAVASRDELDANFGYRYELDTENMIITLQQYTGSEENLTVPELVSIDGTEYRVALKSAGSVDDGIWYKNREQIKSITIEEGVILPEDCSYMFYGCSNCTSLNMSGVDTSEVTNMAAMFAGCSGLSSLDLGGCELSTLKEYSSMFEGCNSLNQIETPIVPNDSISIALPATFYNNDNFIEDYTILPQLLSESITLVRYGYRFIETEKSITVDESFELVLSTTPNLSWEMFSWSVQGDAVSIVGEEDSRAVTGILAGEARIIAAYDNYSATCLVTVGDSTEPTDPTDPDPDPTEPGDGEWGMYTLPVVDNSEIGWGEATAIVHIKPKEGWKLVLTYMDHEEIRALIEANGMPFTECCGFGASVIDADGNAVPISEIGNIMVTVAPLGGKLDGDAGSIWMMAVRDGRLKHSVGQHMSRSNGAWNLRFTLTQYGKYCFVYRKYGEKYRLRVIHGEGVPYRWGWRRAYPIVSRLWGRGNWRFVIGGVRRTVWRRLIGSGRRGRGGTGGGTGSGGTGGITGGLRYRWREDFSGLIEDDDGNEIPESQYGDCLFYVPLPDDYNGETISVLESIDGESYRIIPHHIEEIDGIRYIVFYVIPPADYTILYGVDDDDDGDVDGGNVDDTDGDTDGDMPTGDPDTKKNPSPGNSDGEKENPVETRVVTVISGRSDTDDDDEDDDDDGDGSGSGGGGRHRQWSRQL